MTRTCQHDRHLPEPVEALARQLIQDTMSALCNLKVDGSAQCFIRLAHSCRRLRCFTICHDASPSAVARVSAAPAGTAGDNFTRLPEGVVLVQTGGLFATPVECCRLLSSSQCGLPDMHRSGHLVDRTIAECLTAIEYLLCYRLQTTCES